MRNAYVCLLAAHALLGACGSSSPTCIDADGDGYGGGSSCLGVDCDDDDPAVHPGADETVGDGVDQDCDGGEICLADGDGDHHRTALTVASTDLDCTDPGEADAATPSDDCDDTRADVHGGALEVPGDGVDQSCDGTEACFEDADGDGARGPGAVVSADLGCDDPGERPASAPVDCADSPVADPSCGGAGGASCSPLLGEDACALPDVDEDCDGVADEDAADLYFLDVDGDTFGGRDTGLASCAPVVGRILDGSDCNDSDAAVWIERTRFIDADADGHGAYETAVVCEGSVVPVGFAAEPTDCDPLDALTYPSAPDLPGDGVDQRCGDGDVAVDDVDGIFVAPAPLGDDMNAGTKAAPVATLDRALTLSVETQVIFIADGTYSFPSIPLNRSLHGGYDATFTTRGGGESTILNGQRGLTVLIGKPLALDRLTLHVSGESEAVALIASGAHVTLHRVRATVDGDVKSNAINAYGSTVFVDRSALSCEQASATTSCIVAAGGRLVVTRTSILAAAPTVTGGGANGIDAVYDFSSAENSPALVAIVGNTITAGFGGGPMYSVGVLLQGTRSRALIANNTIHLSPTSAPYAQGRYGIGLFNIMLPGSADVINNIVVANVGTNGASGVHVFSGNADVSVHGNDFRLQGDVSTDCVFSDAGTCYDAAGVAACAFASCGASSGNISVDPLFANPGFDLHATSACIDAGRAPTIATALFSPDLRGHTRPLGAAIDIGALEYTP